MKNLIKAEWFKLSKSSIFKILLLINLILAAILLLMKPRTGYRAFRLGIAYLIYHTNIGLIFTSAFLCEDFSNKSFAKAIIFWVGMVLLLSAFICSAVITSSLLNGFGMDLSLETCVNILFFAFCGIVGCTSISSIMILFSTIAKRKIPTIMAIYLSK